MSSEKLLEMQIDEAVAEFILKQVDAYTQQVSEHAETQVAAAKAKFEAKAEKLFAFADKQIDEAKTAIREEYSAKLVSKLEEKNARIADLEEEVDNFKEQLTERVNTFLKNSKEEVRTLIEEEQRVDADEFKAQHIIEQIRDMVGASTQIVQLKEEDEGKVARLEQDIQALKERVAQKNQVNKYLKAQIKKAELLESVPSADRDFYAERLEGVETVEEADERFTKIKKALDKYRVQQIEEELAQTSSKGYVAEEAEEPDFEDVPSLEEASWLPDRMKTLAGI